jgi:hypothetical protein
MITPASGQIVIPQQIADGLWINSVSIIAPSATRPISAQIRVSPFNSESGIIYSNMSKSINIQDVTAASIQYPSIGIAMSGLLQAAQDLISGKQVF